MKVTSTALEEYMMDSNSAKRISENEAKVRGGKLIEREFSMETSDEEFAQGDVYSYMGAFSLKVEEVFTSIFMNHRIAWFTGYKVSETTASFGRTFKVSTIGVQMSETEWRR